VPSLPLARASLPAGENGILGEIRRETEREAPGDEKFRSSLNWPTETAGVRVAE